MTDIAVYNLLKNNSIPGDYHIHGKELVIYIEDGDWKHEHLYTQVKLTSLGFTHLYQDVEPSDSDSYTSTHHYLIP